MNSEGAHPAPAAGSFWQSQKARLITLAILGLAYFGLRFGFTHQFQGDKTELLECYIYQGQSHVQFLRGKQGWPAEIWLMLRFPSQAGYDELAGGRAALDLEKGTVLIGADRFEPYQRIVLPRAPAPKRTTAISVDKVQYSLVGPQHEFDYLYDLNCVQPEKLLVDGSKLPGLVLVLLIQKDGSYTAKPLLFVEEEEPAAPS